MGENSKEKQKWTRGLIYPVLNALALEVYDKNQLLLRESKDKKKFIFSNRLLFNISREDEK